MMISYIMLMTFRTLLGIICCLVIMLTVIYSHIALFQNFQSASQETMDLKWKPKDSGYSFANFPDGSLNELKPNNLLILFWSKLLISEAYVNINGGLEPFRTCPVSNCFITNNRRSVTFQ